MPKASRVSTVVTPSPIGGRANVSSKSSISISRPTITPELMKDPNAVAKILTDLAENQMTIAKALGSSPFASVWVQKNVSLTQNKQIDIKHGLGRDWQYAYVIHCYSGAAACALIESGSPPTGTSKSNNCSVIPTGTGTYDILIA